MRVDPEQIRRVVINLVDNAVDAALDSGIERGVEVGWRLDPSAWHHGYATEAAREALRFGFENAGLEAIVSFASAAGRGPWGC